MENLIMNTAEKKRVGKAGRFTLPIDTGMEKWTGTLMEKWKPDAVRDSDGTQLPADIDALGQTVYSTLSLVRADQEWARAHRDQLQQMYLLSTPVTALGESVEIDLMKGWFREQFEVDCNHDPKRWWEVIDRTSGEVVDPDDWSFDPETGRVTVRNAYRHHAYTATFLVYIIWDATSMNNHLINNWTGEHTMSVDTRHPETHAHLLEYLEKWLEEHPRTDVVRLTSLIYHFTNCFNDHSDYGHDSRCRFFDWTGYHFCVSPLALEEFEREKGYALRPEDLVDGGFMNDANRVPSRKYLDWIDFNSRYVAGVAKEWVETIHATGRTAMMFFCDHWIGSEPYGPYFKEIGLDALVNPCRNGLELRRMADVPADVEKEVRLYPYFFPTALHEGADPAAECLDNWVKIRRAHLRSSVDRIGFGGYPSLAVKHPALVDAIEQLADEFREIADHNRNAAPYAAPFKVGVLNAWGKLRSWVDETVSIWGNANATVAAGSLMECLAGMAVEVEFLNFDDIEKNGVPEDMGVLINAGVAGTSWSGGKHWKNEKVVTAIREWVAGGGGFIGIGEPSACPWQGRFFQLSDVLGVEQESGMGLCSQKPADFNEPASEGHFILEDYDGALDLGDDLAGGVYRLGDAAAVLLKEGGHVRLAANEYGDGRGVYFSGIKFSGQNIRLLLRAIYWAASRQEDLKKWYSSNVETECAAFPEAGDFVVVNNSNRPQETTVCDPEGNETTVSLKGRESKWYRVENMG